MARQHAALLQLLDNHAPEQAFQIAADPDTAADAALGLLDHGAINDIALVLLTCPQLSSRPEGILALAALGTLSNNDEQTDRATSACIAASTPIQLRTWQVHLRRFLTALRRANPDQNTRSIDTLITHLTAAENA